MSEVERFDDTHYVSLGSTTRELKPGDIVGGAYKLKSLLGQGGMGYVFLAEHNIIKRDYALKIIRPDKMDDFSWQRFEIEGRVIAKLDHPNIVKIYDMGIDQGSCPFYVMDLLLAQPLADYINRGDGLTFDQCLDVFHQVAQGLAYAHRKGIVHRDIKPANIILLKENDGFQGKIVDFGLAKVINSDAGSSQPQTITAKGQVFGSPYYMSPEQCLGQPLDHRADIYSLGCALYESIAGEPPFIGVNAVQTMMMHSESAMPKLADRFSAQPAIAVDSLIAKMTAKEPYNRYQSMDEVAAALDRLQARGSLHSLSIVQRNHSARVEGESDSSVVQSSFLTRADSKWLLLGSILVILSVVFVATYLYHDKIEGQRSAPMVSPNVVSILNFGPIKSRLVSGTGYKEFVFPNTPIGALADLGGGKPQVASGSVFVDRRSAVALLVDEYEVPLTFKYPQVFEQIGKNEFQGLYLKARGSLAKIGGSDGHGPALDLSGLARSDRIAYSQKQLIAMLKIVISWPQLAALTLDGFAFSEQVFQLIDGLPNLSVLHLKRADFSMKELAQQKFLNRLFILTIEDPVNSSVDPLLYKLPQCPNLTSLRLDNVDFLTESFRQLKRCPKLTQLSLNKSEISNDVIEEISQLKHLTVFHSEGKKLTDSQIASLAKLKRLNVALEASDYAGASEMRDPAKLKAYRAKYPTVVFK